MNRICLAVLIGLPAVGKTTLCKFLMECESLTFNIFHFCYDNFIHFNSLNPAQYKEQRDSLLKYLSIIIQTFKTSDNLPTELISMEDQYKSFNSKDVIILCDDNHYYRSMRYKLYQMSREYGVSFFQIYFERDLDSALAYNNLRSDSTNIPKDILIQMSQRMEPPNILRHKWEEKTLILKGDNLNRRTCQEIIKYVIEILNTPMQPLIIKSKIVTPQSSVHELDLLMRKHVRALMISSVEANKELLAKQLNNKRREILKEFQLKFNGKFENNLDLNKYVEMLNEIVGN